jgi:hypothetical protein
MESRAAGYRSALEARLGGALTMALQATPVAAAPALHLLHAYVELGDAAPAEAALRRVVVAPLVARAVAEHKVRGCFVLCVCACVWCAGCLPPCPPHPAPLLTST